jgi:ribosomal protein S6--L-glutamate ligase
VGRGAVIDYEIDPELRDEGVNCVELFCADSGINLAAFDVLFDRSQKLPKPLLSEINFLFGRKGLGGSPHFYDLLNEAVFDWVSNLS